MDEFPTQRKMRREFRHDDRLLDKVSVFFDRYKWVGVLFWTVCGGGIGSLIYRFYLARDMQTVKQDITDIKKQDLSRDSNVVQIHNTLNVLLKGQCFDRTQNEQYFMGIICPDNIYKGSMDPVNKKQ